MYISRFDRLLDPLNVFLMGLSHGGFLVTSISATYPVSIVLLLYNGYGSITAQCL